jgi:enamine deaminase RidA (YjgF/YER057c/UK114 family)
MLGTPAEKWYGYSQAVRVGDVVYVSGQTGVESHDGPQDLHGQMLVAYQRIAAVLAEVGLTLADVADEVVYVTDLAAAAHSTARRDSYGENVTVASTLIGVAAIGSAYRGCPALVEIKCVAARTEPAS